MADGKIEKLRNAKLTFKRSMVWESEIENYVKNRIKGYSLNIPAGSSKLGDIRADIAPQLPEVIKEDMLNLSFKKNIFDTVISDPPWKLNYFHRMRQFFELVRVCKVNGRIIFNATWLPESKAVQLEEIWVRQSARFGNISIMAVFKKITDIYDKEREAMKDD